MRGFAGSILGKKPIEEWDASGLLKLMWDTERSVQEDLGFSERNWWSDSRLAQQMGASGAVFPVMTFIVRWTPSNGCWQPFPPQADEVEKAKMELLRVRFDEQARGENVSRECCDREWRFRQPEAVALVMPHRRLWPAAATNRRSLPTISWQVHLGQGTDEYLAR